MLAKGFIRIFNKEMRSTESSFMLKPSELDVIGVGCFVIEAVSAGTRLHIQGDKSINRQLSINEIPDLYLKYCPLLESGKFLAPENFAAMNIFWYINHDRNPNVTVDRWKLYANRDIEPGEELTLYYPDLLTHPKNIEWVIPEIHI
jgi:SET domain